MSAHLIAFIVNFHAALARGSTTYESQMATCLRHSTICRRYSRFTFCLRHVYAAAPVGAERAPQARSTPRSYRLVGKCPRIRPSELARLCVRLPSFHSKYILIITHFKKLFQSFNRSVLKNRYYSAMHLGFTQLTLLPAAIAAESSIRAKRQVLLFYFSCTHAGHFLLGPK